MEYTKPPLTFEEQADLLLNRGLVADRNELIRLLPHVNYYRFSAYLYPYRNSDDTYRTGTTFDIVWKHYTFDRQLRILIMDAIERVEVAMRTQLIYYHAHTYGAMGYTNSANLQKLDSQQFNSWITDITNESSRSRETFADHFRNKYGDIHTSMPIWMLAEVLSFGKMLTLFNGVEDDIRRTIARNYGIEDDILKSWLKTINVVRNICTHHGRLWNRELGVKPVIPRKQKYAEWHDPYSIGNNRIFSVLTILKYLLGYIAPNSEWNLRLVGLFDKYNTVSLQSMGFPDNWMDYRIWRAI